MKTSKILINPLVLSWPKDTNSYFKLFLCLLICFLNSNIFPRYTPNQIKKPTTPRTTIMIDPAGDAQHVGRKIGDCFERGITMQFAEQLKKTLEKENSNVRILLTHKPGETIQPLQNANFANRMNVDLFLSIHFYQEKGAQPKLYLYHFSSGETLSTKLYDLCFYPYDQAYLFSKDQTNKYVTQIKEIVSQDQYNTLFDFKGPYALQFKPLAGIKAPAVAFEASLKNADDWRQFAEPIIESLKPILEDLKTKTDTL